MRNNAGGEGRSTLQGEEIEEREEKDMSSGTQRGHTVPFAQQRREQMSAVSEQAKHFHGTG